jgi:hypothetical protein
LIGLLLLFLVWALPALCFSTYEDHMKIFTIVNTISGQNLGSYVASCESDALDLMAIDAGYLSYADLQNQIPAKPGELAIY